MVSKGSHCTNPWGTISLPSVTVSDWAYEHHSHSTAEERARTGMLCPRPGSETNEPLGGRRVSSSLWNSALGTEMRLDSLPKIYVIISNDNCEY